MKFLLERVKTYLTKKNIVKDFVKIYGGEKNV